MIHHSEALSFVNDEIFLPNIYLSFIISPYSESTILD